MSAAWRLLWICLGGAAGTGARYLVGASVQRLAGGPWPWGTLTVNVLGSFLLAALAELSTLSGAIPLHLRMALTVGFLGGFTTYSTFNFETLQLVAERSWSSGLANLAVMVVACLTAGWLGILAARWLAAA